MSTDRFALVTGASGEIGRAIAVELARRGVSIGVHYGSCREAAEKTLEEVRAAGAAGRFFSADLADRAACLQLVDDTWNWAGRIDVHVHAAGADVLTGTASRGTFEEKLERLWRVDVAGTIHCCREMGRRMRQTARQGTRPVVITIGWDQSDLGMEADAGELFATVKGAIAAFSRSLAHTLAPDVRVNCIAPGWIRTKWGRTASPPWDRRATAQALLGRWGTPQDVASIAAYLTLPEADFVNGQVIAVNGGFRTFPPPPNDGRA